MFLWNPKPREISSLQEVSVSKTLNLISAKTQHLKHLKDDLRYRSEERRVGKEC